MRKPAIYLRYFYYASALRVTLRILFADEKGFLRPQIKAPDAALSQFIAIKKHLSVLLCQSS